MGAALAAKASGALVSRAVDGGPLLTVANTLRGLEDLARASRARSHAKIVAVTGSAGKTTTKEMLRLACGALGATHASAASYNNHWGVPLSLALMPRETAFGIFEVGMSHFGELRNLVSFVRPHVALVTTIAPAHLEDCWHLRSDRRREIRDLRRHPAGRRGGSFRPTVPMPSVLPRAPNRLAFRACSASV